MTEHDPVFGCETWLGRKDDDGYGLDGIRRAHVAAWTREHGSVPEGMVLDHVCRNRACVALHHLEPVTKSENEKRKAWKYRARRKVCQKGHDLLANGVVTPQGGRVCRACNRAARLEPGQGVHPSSRG